MAGIVLLSLIFLICAVVYLAYRVYHLEKYLSKDYQREYGPCLIPKRDPSAQSAIDELEMAKNMSRPGDKQRHSNLSNEYQRSPNKSMGSVLSSGSRRKRRLDADGEVREVTDSGDEESEVPQKQFDMLDD